MNNPFSIAGKTILVTGAGSGIGRATSIECTKMGANVIVTDINGQSLEETLSMLDVSCGQKHSLFVADLTKQEKLDELVAAIPVIDGLVSNAGISKVLPIQFLNDQDFNRIMDINAFAPMYLTQKIYKKKKISKGGSIVFTVSISGVCMVSMGGVMYAVSKNALDAFMRNAALEFAAKNIRVNSVNPSRVNTNLIKNNASYSQEDLEKDMLTYPLRRYAEPEEIAYAIIYLLSDASAYVTGHSLIIDGGKTLM
ncbi:MAG: SDR family oxidoreductase [Bacteroidaceae bacterium]|nr:SDR family oxidoreductase [Bacteroidaceae bacterium]